MTSISREALFCIKKYNIATLPSWLYPVRAFVIWFLVFCSIMASSIIFGVLALFYRNSDLNLSQNLHISVVALFIQSLPFIWIILALIFILLAYFHFHLTEIGYQFQKRYVFSAAILLSGTFGLVFFATGSCSWLEKAVATNVPFYQYFDTRQSLWQQPNRGLLAGKIIEIKPNNQLVVEDFNNSVWQINNNSIDIETANIKTGQTVKFIGERVDNGIFLSREIRPWFK